MNDPVNTVGPLVVPVIAEFVGYVKGNEQTGCQPNSQPEHIDAAVDAVFPQVAEGDFKVVA